MVIQKFRDRKKELSELEDVLNSKKFELTIIYGRRRIGKTELILKATEKRKRIYYLAVGEKNLERFYSVCAAHYPEASKLKMDWEVLFDFLKDNAEAVIIDEFQNLIGENENILNIFQSIVDITLKGSKLKLFLLGSSVSMITSKVLDYKSPLYGRRTGSMELKAVSFPELKEFFPDREISELVEIYAFADGIPYYLIMIEKEFWAFLQEELKKERSFLRDEIDFLMRYEFEDAGTYKLILEAIANGKTKLNEIKDFLKAKRTDIGPYLRNLIEVGMINRVVPITENIKSRMGRYYLADNFLKFWFRYIYPNLSSLEEGIFDAKPIKKDYNSYLGYVFEDVSRQILIRKKEDIFDFTKIGKWWFKENEIDIVALNEIKKQILFCECKWQENVDAKRILAELKEKAKYVQWSGSGGIVGGEAPRRKEHYAIFAKSFKEKIKEESLMLFDLKDLKEIMSKQKE